MPTSALHVAPVVVHEVWKLRDEARRIVDVGSGFGKYAGLLREYVWGLQGDFEQVDAIEVHRDYYTPERYAQYDNVYFEDARDISPNQWSWYDLVLMVDVLEHITREEAFKLLDNIPGYVVVSTPVDFFHNWEEGWAESERHLSHWKVDDFRSSDGWSEPVQYEGAIITTRDRKR